MTHGLELLERFALPATSIVLRILGSHHSVVSAASSCFRALSSGQNPLLLHTSQGCLPSSWRRFSALPQLVDQQRGAASNFGGDSCSVQRKSESASITASERQASASGGFSTGVTTMSTGQGFKKTFYKRKLPTPPSTAFASQEGRQLFAEALASGHMNGFFKLMEQFSTQDEPSFCGLASLAMVLNALAIDPRRTWKGAWRWFHEQMLDCCRPLDDVKKDGITLPQAACLARCNGARVDMYRYGQFTMEDLRRQVIDVCSSGEQHLVVSYSRRTFLQTGDGHFSPVGGYHPAKDLVLILDVARFKYPPHWVPLSMLYDAMQYQDPATGLPRGFLRMSAEPLLGSVLLTLDVRSRVWQQAHTWLREVAPKFAQDFARSSSSTDIQQLISTLVNSMPLQSLDHFLVVRDNSLSSPATPLLPQRQQASGQSQVPSGRGSPQPHTCGEVVPVSNGDSGSCSSSSTSTMERCLPIGARQQLLTELHALPLYHLVKQVMTDGGLLEACTALSCDTAGLHHTHRKQNSSRQSSPNRTSTTHHEGHVHHSHQHQHSQQQEQHASGSQSTQVHATSQPHAPAETTASQTGCSSSSCPSSSGCCDSSSGSKQSCALSHTPSSIPGIHALSSQLQRLTNNHQQAHSHSQQHDDTRQTGQLGVYNPADSIHHDDHDEPLPAWQLNSGYLPEKATLLLLLRSAGQWPNHQDWALPDLGRAWSTLMDTNAMGVVQAELAFLREQWNHIDEVVADGNATATCGSATCDNQLDCAALQHTRTPSR